MGKCKQRLRARARNQKYQLRITRQEALNLASQELYTDPSSPAARKLITLFGLKAEELSEAGVTYEVLRSLDGLIN